MTSKIYRLLIDVSLLTEKKVKVMHICYICGQAEAIPFKCNYCQESFCNVHINPINHFCPFLDTYDTKGRTC